MSAKQKKSKKASRGTPNTDKELAWTRIAKGGYNTKADQRDVDVKFVEGQLEKRMEAKKSKDYKLADSIAMELQQMGIAYLDDKHEWYTKVIEQKDAKSVLKKKDSDVQSKRKRGEDEVVADENIDDDAPTSEDDDSEEDREDDKFVAKMQESLRKGTKKVKSIKPDSLKKKQKN